MFIRTALKAAIIVIVAFAGISYLAYLRSGNYWLPAFVSDRFQTPEMRKATMGPPTIGQPAYKWLDKGRWVYGDEPPPDVEAITVHEEQK